MFFPCGWGFSFLGYFFSCWWAFSSLVDEDVLSVRVEIFFLAEDGTHFFAHAAGLFSVDKLFPILPKRKQLLQ